MQLFIPDPFTATIYLPAEDVAPVLEDGNRRQNLRGVYVLKNGTVVFKVGAGTYDFTRLL